MSLYTPTQLTFPSENNTYTLAPGALGYFSIVVPAGHALIVSLNQLLANQNSYPQDFSMKGWISKLAGGNSAITNPEAFSRWFLTTYQKTVVTLFDNTTNLGPYDGIAIGLAPNAYCLNVLNVVNETNSFALDITEI